MAAEREKGRGGGVVPNLVGRVTEFRKRPRFPWMNHARPLEESLLEPLVNFGGGVVGAAK